MITSCIVYPHDINKSPEYIEYDVPDNSIRSAEILGIACANGKLGIKEWDYLEIPLSSGRKHVVINPECR